jgi:hypothetical protein
VSGAFEAGGEHRQADQQIRPRNPQRDPLQLAPPLGECLAGLRRYQNHPSRDAQLRLKEGVDPKGILQATR